MMSLNSVVMIGRLTADPELRETQSGIPVCSFCLAIENGYGENKETSFIDCVGWKKTAEFINKYFAKGNRLLLQGRIQTRSWADKDGKKRKATEVVASKVDFVDFKKDADMGGERTFRDTAAISPPAYDEFELLDGDGDLPF